MKQNKKAANVSVKTMAIKCRVVNHLRKGFYNKQADQFTDEEKLVWFDMVYSLTKAAHIELNNYKRNRKQRAVIELLREQRKHSHV